MTRYLNFYAPAMTPKQRLEAFGCGIGLSIVKEICDQSGYSAQLSDSEIATSGLTVTVCGL